MHACMHEKSFYYKHYDFKSRILFLKVWHLASLFFSLDKNSHMPIRRYII